VRRRDAATYDAEVVMSVALRLPELRIDDVWQSDDAFDDALVVHDARPLLADLLDHGNFGVGTFEHPDDGMVILRGACFRLGSDAEVRLPGALDRVRHATVAAIGQVTLAGIGTVANVRDLMRWIDCAIGDTPGVTAVELAGTFGRVEVSTVVTQLPDPTATAAFGRTEGSVAGFRMRPLKCPARYHLQFLNRDRIFGGRLIDLSIIDAQVRLSPCAELHRVVELRPRSPRNGEARAR
jgi:acetolactate decarboxylase